MEELVKFLKTQGRYNDFLDVIRLDFNLKPKRADQTRECKYIFDHMILWYSSRKVTGIDWALLHALWVTNGMYDGKYTYAELYALKKEDERISKMLKFARSQHVGR